MNNNYIKEKKEITELREKAIRYILQEFKKRKLVKNSKEAIEFYNKFVLPINCFIDSLE